MLDFQGIYFWKNRNSDFWVQKQKNENPRQPFNRTCNLASCGVYCLRFTLKSCITDAFESCTFIDPKSRDTTSLKCIFLITMDFAEILFHNAKLMLNQVQQVSHRHLPSFLNYWERSLGGGGVIRPPPPPPPANSGLTLVGTSPSLHMAFRGKRRKNQV